MPDTPQVRQRSGRCRGAGTEGTTDTKHRTGDGEGRVKKLAYPILHLPHWGNHSLSVVVLIWYIPVEYPPRRFDLILPNTHTSRRIECDAYQSSSGGEAPASSMQCAAEVKRIMTRQKHRSTQRVRAPCGPTHPVAFFGRVGPCVRSVRLSSGSARPHGKPQDSMFPVKSKSRLRPSTTVVSFQTRAPIRRTASGAEETTKP